MDTHYQIGIMDKSNYITGDLYAFDVVEVPPPKNTKINLKQNMEFNILEYIKKVFILLGIRY